MKNRPEFFQKVKLKKKYQILSVVAGMFASLLADDLNLEFEFIKEGMFWGLSFGVFWALIRFYLQGEDGLVRSQKEMTESAAYLMYFLGGVVVGWAVRKLILLFI